MYMHTQTHRNANTHIHTQTHTHIRTCSHTNTLMHMHTHIETYTHTHSVTHTRQTHMPRLACTGIKTTAGELGGQGSAFVFSSAWVNCELLCISTQLIYKGTHTYCLSHTPWQPGQYV